MVLSLHHEVMSHLGPVASREHLCATADFVGLVMSHTPLCSVLICPAGAVAHHSLVFFQCDHTHLQIGRGHQGKRPYT